MYMYPRYALIMLYSVSLFSPFSLFPFPARLLTFLHSDCNFRLIYEREMSMFRITISLIVNVFRLLCNSCE